MSAQKVLVVFYSRSGATRKIAEALTAELKCDTEEIATADDRAGFLGITRSLIEAIRKRPARIVSARVNPSSYDLVVIGTPVWAWSVSSPIRAYLINNGNNLPQVAFFCTMGGRGSEGTFAQMQDLAGKPPRATAAFTTPQVLAGDFPRQLAEFVQALGLAKP